MWIEWLKTENGKLTMKRKIGDLIGAKMADIFTNQFVNKALAIMVNTLGKVWISEMRKRYLKDKLRKYNNKN